MTSSERISGGYGSWIIDDATALTRVYTTVVVIAEAVIAEMYEDSDLSTNVADTNHNCIGKTLPVGYVLYVANGATYGKIKLTSGSVSIQ